jgi:hypothetical protein
VLVRKDLSESYRAVQAGHAVAEWLLRDQTWQNETLVYLGVDNENELTKWKRKLEFRNMKYAAFREPDIGNQLTAIATLTDGKIFKKLKLI